MGNSKPRRPSDIVAIDDWTEEPAQRYLDNNRQLLIGNLDTELPVYYVVWHGRQRGIFTSWDEDDGAKWEVDGFSHNKHGRANGFNEAKKLLLEGLQAEMTVGDLEVPVSSPSQTHSANGIPATEESTGDEISSTASLSQTPSELSTASSVADEEMLDDHEASVEPLSSPQPTPAVESSTKMAIGEDEPEVPRLCREQQDALDLALEGHNLFITGSGGCGKSVLVKALFQKLSAKKRVHLLAPTGQAAVNIGGATIQSYMKWGTERPTLECAVEKAQNHKLVRERVTQSDALIIDEISMVDNHLFTRLSETMSQVRQKAARKEGSNLDLGATFRPFGGIQVIVVGDFYQLPPVQPLLCCKSCDANWTEAGTTPKCSHMKDTDKWAFKSIEWDRCDFSYVHLTKIHRQQDEEFVKILQKCRSGQLDDDDDVDILLGSQGVKDGVRLFSMNSDVDKCNKTESSNLSSDAVNYERLDHLEKQGHNKAEEPPQPRHAKSLELKVGMPVMLLANIDVKKGLCNGSQGIIRGFSPRLGEEPNEPKKRNYRKDPDGFEIAKRRYEQILSFRAKKGIQYPEVEFHNGVRRIIGPDCTISRLGTTPYSYWSQVQIPLTPCWAMTIHKSQGMSLDRVVADITNVWEDGQAYVALSRTRSLEGLQLKGNNLRRTLKGKFSADKEVFKFMNMAEANAKKEGQ